jgi:hypothetical protein
MSLDEIPEFFNYMDADLVSDDFTSLEAQSPDVIGSSTPSPSSAPKHLALHLSEDPISSSPTAASYCPKIFEPSLFTPPASSYCSEDDLQDDVASPSTDDESDDLTPIIYQISKGTLTLVKSRIHAGFDYDSVTLTPNTLGSTAQFKQDTKSVQSAQKKQSRQVRIQIHQLTQH